MEFWTNALPTLIFLAPVAAMLYFSRHAGARPEAMSNGGMAIFAFACVLAAFGVFRFETPVRLEFPWLYSGEPSGYFEFALRSGWGRYVWILFSAATLFAFSSLDGRHFFRDPGARLRFIFLAGAFLASAVACLSENILLSLLFIELMYFLLHAFGLRMGEGEAELERASYLKRGVFLFVSLLALMGLAFTREFTSESVILLGVILYLASFLVSRHNFLDWGYLPLYLIQVGGGFFLLDRVIREDVAVELWIPLTVLSGITAAIFSFLSLFSLSSLGAAFWFTLSFTAYLLFLRFGSGRPDEVFWGAYEAIGLGALFALCAFLRFGERADSAWKRGLAFCCVAILLGLVSGAVPGIDLAAVRTGAESPVKLAATAALTFLLSFIMGKSLGLSFPRGSGSPASFSPAWAPTLVVLLVQAGAVMRFTELYGESPFRMGLAYIYTAPYVLAMAAAVGLGLVMGLLLGSNARFVAGLQKRERKMEEIFPRIDSASVGWSDRLERGWHGPAERASARLGQWSDRVAAFLQSQDRFFFAEKLYRGFREYGLSLSLFTRLFHSGSTRSYLFIGTIVTIFASLLFLMEGR